MASQIGCGRVSFPRLDAFEADDKLRIESYAQEMSLMGGIAIDVARSTAAEAFVTDKRQFRDRTKPNVTASTVLLSVEEQAELREDLWEAAIRKEERQALGSSRKKKRKAQKGGKNKRSRPNTSSCTDEMAEDRKQEKKKARFAVGAPVKIWFHHDWRTVKVQAVLLEGDWDEECGQAAPHDWYAVSVASLGTQWYAFGLDYHSKEMHGG